MNRNWTILYIYDLHYQKGNDMLLDTFLAISSRSKEVFMSGSGTGPIGRTERGTTPEYCEVFSGETLVNSPDPSIIETISLGDILDIDVTIVSGVSVIAVIAPAGILGGLSNFSNRLEHCVSLGFQYIATVIELNGGLVRVRISPKA
jgi:hypothetical protein